MKKNILKKIFIKLSKILGFELIDQNEFTSPTLQKELNQELSIINEKSIILPLGEVDITKKVSSVLIILRTNTDIDIWDQSKKRLFEQPKIEYTIRSLNSLLKSINFSKLKYPNIKFEIKIVDDKSEEKNLKKIQKIINESNLDINIVPLNHSKYKDKIKQQKNAQTFSNLASLLQSFELGKEDGEDLCLLNCLTFLFTIGPDLNRVVSFLNKLSFFAIINRPYF